MVTAEQVWSALGEIPDPEIPVISLVDLGVIRDVAVDGSHVRIELTPTFLGCPALEAMTRALEEKVSELGGEPDVTVVRDDSWSTDRITPPDLTVPCRRARPRPTRASATSAQSAETSVWPRWKLSASCRTSSDAA